MLNLLGKSLEHLCLQGYQTKLYKFRVGKLSNSAPDRISEHVLPVFESSCVYIVGTVSQFMAWCIGDAKASGEFAAFQPNQHFAYLDYKHVPEINSTVEFTKMIDWSVVGLPGRGAKESTMWLGSQGSHTPLHSDSYGYNVVCQVHGRKKWVLFPWESFEGLHPTRIPYEESSVYSDLNMFQRDISKEPELFTNLRPRIVILEPGDVLFVPPKWWHYVECLELSLSINTWVELESDHLERVNEAITRCLVSLVTNELDLENAKELLNPNELELLSQPRGAAFDCLEATVTQLKSQASTKIDDPKYPSVLLERGTPVPLVFQAGDGAVGSDLGGVPLVLNMVGKDRCKRPGGADNVYDREGHGPNKKMAKVDEGGELDVPSGCFTESSSFKPDQEQDQSNPVTDPDGDSTCSLVDGSRTVQLFLKAVTHPSVIELITKKILEMSTDP